MFQRLDVVVVGLFCLHAGSDVVNGCLARRVRWNQAEGHADAETDFIGSSEDNDSGHNGREGLLNIECYFPSVWLCEYGKIPQAILFLLETVAVSPTTSGLATAHTFWWVPLYRGLHGKSWTLGLKQGIPWHTWQISWISSISILYIINAFNTYYIRWVS